MERERERGGAMWGLRRAEGEEYEGLWGSVRLHLALGARLSPALRQALQDLEAGRDVPLADEAGEELYLFLERLPGFRASALVLLDLAPRRSLSSPSSRARARGAARPPSP